MALRKVESEEEAKIHAQVMAGRDYGSRVMYFLDGPLAGEVHEIEAGWPCPNSCGIPHEGGEAWYEVSPLTGNATFIGYEEVKVMKPYLGDD